MELNKEILKGHIDTMILAILEKNDSYGFEIAKNVLEQTTFELKDGTLYISLKRLESKGFIESYWQRKNEFDCSFGHTGRSVLHGLSEWVSNRIMEY